MFFEVDSQQLSKALLGKILCRKFADGTVLKRRITETEAYGGFETPDSASHAYKGKTKRNMPMFCGGGTLYVYLCYGIFNLINIISGKEGDPQGVLICGVEGMIGSGRVGKLFKAELAFSGKSIINNNDVWLEDDGFVVNDIQITKKVRVGIDYANETDKKRFARFCMNK